MSDSEETSRIGKRTSIDEYDSDEHEDSNVNNNNYDQEEEEEEEEDYEDNYDYEDGSTRKKQRRSRNQFLDVEAEVDEDEEEFEEDEDDLTKEDGFIQETVEHERHIDDRLHRQMDRARDKIDDEDAERIAQELRERYGRSTASKYRGESGMTPQRLLLPSVNDPKIWVVKCKAGKEKIIIQLILRKKLSMQYTQNPVEIFSAFQRDAFHGNIYIEARKEAAVLHAIKGITNVYASRVKMLSLQEYVDLLRVNKTNDAALVPGSYVRIKRGKYKNDLAIVENLSENGLDAQLKMIPRLDYNKNSEAYAGEGKRKRPVYNEKNRPHQMLFSEQEALKHDSRNLIRKGPNSFQYGSDTYENGYLYKDYKVSLLITDPKEVDPKLEELMGFTNADEEIDVQSLLQTINKQTEATLLQPGDLVEVFEGEQANVVGRVTNVQKGIVTIKAQSGDLKGREIEVLSKSLRKKFHKGDHVKVVSGRYMDDSGMIVEIVNETATLVVDNSQEEITVFTKDLAEASESSGAVHLGKYEIHNLIQFGAGNVGCIIRIDRQSVRIVNEHDEVETIAQSSIIRNITNSIDAFSTDKNGSEIRVGDTVREIDGAAREGVIIHIFKKIVFMHDRSMVGRAGVFAAASNGVKTVAAKGARIANAEPELNKMNPMLQLGSAMGGPAPFTIPRQGGRDKALSKHVRISRGPYKGLNGRIRDSTDATARVELHTNSKIITVNKIDLKFEDDKGNYISFREFVTPRGMESVFSNSLGNNGGKTPGYYGSEARTPGWASGGLTPAWAGAGGRTPMVDPSKTGLSGSRTPAWNRPVGAQTPSWNASGARTPAWNASGARTPAWNASGARTPAWNASGARTPAWNASGARTPAWNSSGYKTPTLGSSGSKTPAWNADSSKTPISASTIGSRTPAWRADDKSSRSEWDSSNSWDNTPGYIPGDKERKKDYNSKYDGETSGGYNSSWDKSTKSTNSGFNYSDDDDDTSPQYGDATP